MNILQPSIRHVIPLHFTTKPAILSWMHLASKDGDLHLPNWIISANGWRMGISNWISFWKHATAPSVRSTRLNILTRFSKTGRRATFVHWQMLSVLILPLSRKKDRRKTPSGQNRTPSAQQPSKFRNFEERSYNMDELTKELLRSN